MVTCCPVLSLCCCRCWCCITFFCLSVCRSVGPSVRWSVRRSVVVVVAVVPVAALLLWLSCCIFLNLLFLVCCCSFLVACLLELVCCRFVVVGLFVLTGSLLVCCSWCALHAKIETEPILFLHKQDPVPSIQGWSGTVEFPHESAFCHSVLDAEVWNRPCPHFLVNSS